MGLYMDTNSVKNQLKEMNQNLKEAVLNTELLLGKIDGFINAPLLKAESYGNLKEYYGSFHVPALRGLICYAEDLAAQNEIYSSMIEMYFSDVGYVDEDGLTEDAERIQRTLDILEDAPKMTSGLLSVKATVEKQKRDIEEKLEKINQFVISTQNIYRENHSFEALLKQGIGTMQRISYDSSNQRFQIAGVNPEWRNELNKCWGGRNGLISTGTELINRIKEQCPELSEEEISRILDYMAENPVGEKQTLEEYLAVHKTEIDRLGLGASAVSQGFSSTYSTLGKIDKRQGEWLLENALKMLSYSKGTADDLLQYADDVGKATQIGAQGAEYAALGGSKIPIIGSAIDYGLLRAGGAETGEAIVKTAAHAGIGCAVGAVVTTLVVGSTGGVAGLIIGGGIIITLGAGKLFDYAYDNIGWLQETGNFIDKKLDEAGKCLKGLFTGSAGVLE